MLMKIVRKHAYFLFSTFTLFIAVLPITPDHSNLQQQIFVISQFPRPENRGWMAGQLQLGVFHGAAVRHRWGPCHHLTLGGAGRSAVPARTSMGFVYVTLPSEVQHLVFFSIFTGLHFHIPLEHFCSP